MALLATLFLAFLPTTLLYIDPGSGSMLIQILIAGALGAGYAVKTFWHRILFFFRKLAGKNQEEQQ